MSRHLAFALLLVAATTGCDEAEPSTPPADTLADVLDTLAERYALPSIAVAVVADGQVTTEAVGLANVADDVPAGPDTLYGLASCSKPIVGLATALLMEELPAFDLDEDVNVWLDWPEPLTHPDAPGTPVTMRHLLTHRSGIAADGDADYDTYPKPDPDQPLDAFMQAVLADPDFWLETAPGEGEEYSNLGVALAGLVIEKAAGQDFAAFCTERIFDPLGLDDTRWFYSELTADQQARHAIPYDEDGEPYAIYAFNDYPSGLLRSTPRDFGRLIAVLADGGGDVFAPTVIARFQDLPMLIDDYADGDVTGYEHSGGEAGVNTYFTYRTDGTGYLYLTNGDLDDDALDAFAAELDARLEAEASP